MLAVEEQSCRGGCALATSRRLLQGCLLKDRQTKGPAPSLFTYDDHAGVQNTVVVPADDEDANSLRKNNSRTTLRNDNDGKLQMPRHNTVFRVITGGVNGEFENLSSEVLEDCSEIY